MRQFLTYCQDYFLNGGEVHDFNSEIFLQMASRLREPFQSTVNDRNACMNGEGQVSIMLKNSSLKYITNEILFKNKDDEQNDDNPAKKKKRRKGNAAVSTIFGATGHHAVVQSQKRDEKEQANVRESRRKKLENEQKLIQQALTSLYDRKERIMRAKDDAERLNQRLVGRTTAAAARTVTAPPVVVGEEQPAHANNADAHGGETAPPGDGGMLPEQERILEYYEVSESCTRGDFECLLRLFVPNSGVLSKRHPEQWAVVLAKVQPTLSKLAVDAKEEEFNGRLTQIQGELEQLT